MCRAPWSRSRAVPRSLVLLPCRAAVPGLAQMSCHGPWAPFVPCRGPWFCLRAVLRSLIPLTCRAVVPGLAQMPCRVLNHASVTCRGPWSRSRAVPGSLISLLYCAAVPGPAPELCCADPVLRPQSRAETTHFTMSTTKRNSVAGLRATSRLIRLIRTGHCCVVRHDRRRRERRGVASNFQLKKNVSWHAATLSLSIHYLFLQAVAPQRSSASEQLVYR